MSDVRVAIGVPSGEMVHADFAMSLAEVCIKSPCNFALINSKSSLVPIGRNFLVQEARDKNCSHILMLDSDMIFPGDVVKQLLDRDKDIVGGTYSQRVKPFRTLGNTLDNTRADVETGLIEMLRMPTGCLMIRMEVFDKLTKPYFRCVADEETGAIWGEDYAFCNAAKAAGFNIYCDVDLSKQLIHIGSKHITVDDFEVPE